MFIYTKTLYRQTGKNCPLPDDAEDKKWKTEGLTLPLMFSGSLAHQASKSRKRRTEDTEWVSNLLLLPLLGRSDVELLLGTWNMLQVGD